MSDKISVTIGDDDKKGPGFVARLWSFIQWCFFIFMLFFFFLAYDVNYREPGVHGHDLVDRR